MAEIFTKNGDRILVDDENFEELNEYRWHLDGRGYAQRTGPTGLPKPKRRSVYMHRQLLGLAHGDGRHGDHCNMNKLDNQKANLRVCSHAENMRNRKAYANNTSGFKGVGFDKRDKKWRADIWLNGKHKHLGYFSTPEAAYSAYCQAATELHGAFANHGAGEEVVPQPVGHGQS